MLSFPSTLAILVNLSMSGACDERSHQRFLATFRTGYGAERLVEAFYAIAAVVRQVHDERLGRIDHITTNPCSDSAECVFRQRAFAIKDTWAWQGPVNAFGSGTPRLEMNAEQ